MKRSFLLLLALPVLSSCGIEDDYAMNDYRYPPPQARVETPYYSAPRYEGSGNYHGHQSAYRRYHGHYGNNNPVIVRNPRNYGPMSPANVHGHSSQAQSAGNTHGHPSQNQAGNSHGHPSQGTVQSSRSRAFNPYGNPAQPAANAGGQVQAQAGGNVHGHDNQAALPPASESRGNTTHGHD